MSTSLGHWSRRRSRSSRGSAEMMSKNKIEEKKEVGMEFLNVEDFKVREILMGKLSPFDILVEVCAIASFQLEQETPIKEPNNKNNVINNKATEKSLANSAPHDSSAAAAADHDDQFEARNGFERKNDDGVEARMEPTRSSSSSSGQKSTKLNSAATTGHGHGEAHTRSSASMNGMNKLKRKLDNDHDHKDGAPKNKNLPSRNRTMINLNLPRTLPKEHMEKIRSLGGIRLETLELVFEKKLYSSDILKSQNRLTMPPAQIISENFLKAKEIANLQRNDTLTELTLIDPRLEMKKVSLGRWNLSPKKHNYVLKTTWSRIVGENELGEHDVIQVWWFRNDKEKIHLALAIAKRAERDEKETSNGAKEADDEKDHDSANGGDQQQQQQHWMVPKLRDE